MARQKHRPKLAKKVVQLARQNVVENGFSQNISQQVRTLVEFSAKYQIQASKNWHRYLISIQWESVWSQASFSLGFGTIKFWHELRDLISWLVASDFWIDISDGWFLIFISLYAKSPNPTLSADLNGWAVRNACEKLMDRLDMMREMYGHVSWEELIKKAIFHRVDLAATGFFRSRKVDFDGKQVSSLQFTSCSVKKHHYVQ